MFQFKGCAVYIPAKYPVRCGVNQKYCTTCLEARIEHIEGRLLSVLTSSYETPELSHVDIENNLRAVAKKRNRYADISGEYRRQVRDRVRRLRRRSSAAEGMVVR